MGTQRGAKARRFTRRAALFLAAVLAFSALSCHAPEADKAETPGPASSNSADPRDSTEAGTDPAPEKPDSAAVLFENDVLRAGLTDTEGGSIYHYAEKGDPDYAEADYTSFYAAYGREIRITDVCEDADTGMAYVLLDGHPHYLGLDFLSRAMIFCTEPGDSHATEEDVYNAWKRYYVTRWNMILPEIPLYEESALLLYSSQVEGPEKLSPSDFSLSKAVLQWQVPEKDSGILVAGSAGKLSGQFRYPAFAKDVASAPDVMVEELTNGLETVTVTAGGRPVWNDSVVLHHEEKENEDGSRTYTITLLEGLCFSDGSQVTAKDYLAFPLAFLSAPGKEADASYADQMGRVYSGFDLIDDMTFSVTIQASALPDANILSAVRFTAQYAEMWLGGAEILSDGEGCFLSDSFYERSGDGHYLSARRLRETAADPAVLQKYPFSGPYRVIHYDAVSAGGSPVVILRKNDLFTGLPEGTERVGTLVLRHVDEGDVLTQFEKKTLDVYVGLSGENEVREALRYAEQSDGRLKTFRYETGETHVLHFRADLGPVQFREVRQALACLLSRSGLSEALPGGIDDAKLLLEDGGWIYDAKGEPYKSGIRFKRIDASLMGPDDKSYAAIDGSLQTFEKDGYYYMPLVLNFFGLQNSDLTARLAECFKNADFASSGMLVTVTEGSFSEVMDELYEAPLSGYYGGVPQMCVFSAFTRNYGSLLTDASFMWAVDPEEYRLFSQHFLLDPADIVWLKD